MLRGFFVDLKASFISHLVTLVTFVNVRTNFVTFHCQSEVLAPKDYFCGNKGIHFYKRLIGHPGLLHRFGLHRLLIDPLKPSPKNHADGYRL